MARLYGLFTVLSLLAFLSCKQVDLQVNIENLKCEYLVNPIGLDTKNPRFIWQIRAGNKGDMQKACQIVVGTDLESVKNEESIFWDSGVIKSNTIPVVYNGKKLEPFTRYFWKVKVKMQDGRWSAYSKTASFETGVMKSGNWSGSWITDNYDYNIKPAPYFRKEFKIKRKVKSARAYIAVAGLYELYLNGEKVGNHRLDPIFTRFDRRTLYVTYDVTKNIQNGDNTIGVLLGNGWYNHQSESVWYFNKAPWRARPKFCMDLKIEFEDGSKQLIFSNREWKTSYSPIIFNSIYTAEHYDARLEQTGWSKPGFDDSQWNSVLLTNVPSKNITAQVLHPVRNVEDFSAQKIIKFSDRNYVVDFGQNMAGVTKLKIKGIKGTTIRLKHGERLYENGHVDISNIDFFHRSADGSDPFQTDVIILSGNKDEFMPKFNYKGFRYVEVNSDKPVEFSKENLTAYFMHSDVPPVGKINSSNEILNKIWKATNVSYLSNLFGYPTDCPQREKNGWTGDAHINIETALYNYDAITVYEKWMADHRDEQQPNGMLPAIIPSSSWGYKYKNYNGPDWTSTIAIIPWNVYLFYGDAKIVEDNYNNIKRYVDYIDDNYPSGITDWGLGDWIPVKSKTPIEFTSSVYYYVDALILSKIAEILGKKEDYPKYKALANKVKNAINEKYLNPETGIYGLGLQTELSTALYWGLVPEEHISKVANQLARRVEADNNQLDVGLLGSKALLNALSENGYADIAYKLVAQETFPSWGWWIVNGATTLYEQWPLNAKNNSYNHVMFGEINAWFYKCLGGIFPDEEQPGFKNIILKPNFVDGLGFFEARHKSLYGEIISSWEKTGDEVKYQVEIPVNSTATLFLKTNRLTEDGKKLSANERIQVVSETANGVELKLVSGTYSFEINNSLNVQ